jgi:hypothetical protein
MSDRSTARLTIGAGLVFLVVFIVGFVITPTGAPDSNDPALKVAAYVTDHRGTLLTSEFLIGVASIPFLVFVGAMWRMMRRDDDGPLPVIAVGGALVSMALVTVGMALLMTLAYSTPIGDPGLVRILENGGWITLNASGFALAVFIGAVSVAAMMRGFLASWTAWLGIPVALAQVVGGAALASGDGAMSPQGTLPFIFAIGFVAWVLAVCADLAFAHRTESRTAPTAPAPA